MDQIKKYIEERVPLSENDWEIFSSKLVKRTQPKQTSLLQTGQTENYIYLLGILERHKMLVAYRSVVII